TWRRICTVNRTVGFWRSLTMVAPHDSLALLVHEPQQVRPHGIHRITAAKQQPCAAIPIKYINARGMRDLVLTLRIAWTIAVRRAITARQRLQLGLGTGRRKDA